MACSTGSLGEIESMAAGSCAVTGAGGLAGSGAGAAVTTGRTTAGGSGFSRRSLSTSRMAARSSRTVGTSGVAAGAGATAACGCGAGASGVWLKWS